MAEEPRQLHGLGLFPCFPPNSLVRTHLPLEARPEILIVIALETYREPLFAGQNAGRFLPRSRWSAGAILGPDPHFVKRETTTYSAFFVGRSQYVAILPGDPGSEPKGWRTWMSRSPLCRPLLVLPNGDGQDDH